MSSDHVQTVRNAWINALRAEVLRVGPSVPEVARVAAVGVWIATYADADGGNAFPGRDTLARLAGCSQETVTRAVKVLLGVGLLVRRRRPNASSVYQLMIPMGRPDWAPHMVAFTDTRQRRAHAKKKAQEIAELTESPRTASVDAVRTASVAGVPDSVRSGGSGPSGDPPDSVHGRPRTASIVAVRTASMDAPTSSTPTCGRDPDPDHTPPGLSPQPQVRASARGENDSSPTPQPATATAPPLAVVRCPVCHRPVIPDPRRPGRTTHTHCAERTAS
ncbi:helix-turn-helix domain-containing protein [Streptomyces sp. NPDC050504]|uniref:helix-turn-helix domain-containing protein n=1 Tax=Streptomyces sp. NPDC050504 TaxID=3365618 RepID=UPI0037B3B658